MAVGGCNALRSIALAGIAALTWASVSGMFTVQFPLYEIWEQSPSETPASVLSDDQSSVVGKVRNNNETTRQPPIQKQTQYHLPGSPKLPQNAARRRQKRAVKRKGAQLLDDPTPTRVGKVDKTNETRAKLTLLRPQDSLGGRETSSIPRQGEVARMKQHNSSVGKYDIAREELRNCTLRYFVYGDELLLRTHYNYKLEFKRSRPAMRRRFGEDGLVELGIIQALQRHSLRTMDATKADIFVVPLVMASMIMFDKNNTTRESLDYLRHHHLFQSTQGHRHVIVSLTQHAFDHWGVRNVRYIGLDDDYYPFLQNVTVARDLDYAAIHALTKKRKNRQHEYGELLKGKKPVTLYSFSLGLGATKHIPFINATYEKFRNSSNFIFYQTRQSSSYFNSTVYRHAPVQQSVIDRLPPSSIGFGIEKKEEWLKQYVDSKFCLAIRGDTPHTHALLRSIKVGCIPVIVSDFYPDYAPTLKSTLDMRSFSIFLDEKDFLQDPGKALSSLVELSEETIREKLSAVRFAQEVALFDHPQSLFVPAFLKEAMNTMRNPRPDLSPYYAQS